jgi:hypothetical protein
MIAAITTTYQDELASMLVTIAHTIVGNILLDARVYSQAFYLSLL